MNEFLKKINKLYVGDELVKKLMVLPPYNDKAQSVSERLIALLDIYKIFIPNKATIDIYNRLYIAVISSLEKKDTVDEIKKLNENFRIINGFKRYGVIGGLESFKITGSAGLGKTTSVQRCGDIISDSKVIRKESPLREIIPILFVECVADGSFKSLLYLILQNVDSILGTNYFISNNHQTTTVDVLLSAVSTVLINHVALLVIDEIERVANDSRRGETLINYLTQLVNQSNVSICFVGNESSNKYFESKEYMARRTIGVSIHKMNYDEYFHSFLNILFGYQYTNQKAILSSELERLFYNFSSGVPSIVISLFVETQRNAILSGEEVITSKNLTTTFYENFTNLISYLPDDKNRNIRVNKNDKIVNETVLHQDVDLLFDKTMKISQKDSQVAINYLKDYVQIEFVKI